MSIARTSAFTQTSIHILTTILLVGLFPGVSADCYLDLVDGNEYCGSILSSGAIVGIAVGGAVALIAVGLIVWACLRVRPASQTNVVYPPPNQAPYFPPAQPVTAMAYGSQPSYNPQYPHPVQQGASPNDPSPGYVQGAVPPPQHRAHRAHRTHPAAPAAPAAPASS